MVTLQPRKLDAPDFAGVSEVRRRNMAAIKGKDTKPEMLVRRVVHRAGYRYHLHVKRLPGSPDMVFFRRRKIIEIRGCFWHRHHGCVLAATPNTRAHFWQAKFQATEARDARNLAALRAGGWQVMVIWECEVKDPLLMNRLQAFLGPPAIPLELEAC
ncbi:MAG: DNA mismatch endonuclease Vsr [Acidobacteria bacterium]|nr:DNA mismatch endonuclease Vsr [Acidobacteriota bacterium]